MYDVESSRLDFRRSRHLQFGNLKWRGLEPVVADKEARQYISVASLSALSGEQLQIATEKSILQVVKSGRRRTAESKIDRFKEAPVRTKGSSSQILFILERILERKKE